MRGVQRRVELGLALGTALAVCVASHAAAASDLGRQIFFRHCATCHVGFGGLLGQLPLPNLFSEPLRHGDSEEALFAVIRSGTGSAAMPAFADGLDDAEIRALVAYIRSRRANEAP